MKSATRLFFLLLVFSNVLLAQSRLPVGEWQMHLPNSSCNSVARLGSKIYAGGNGSFMSLDTESGSIKTLSKIDGFSQTAVSRLGVSEATNTLVVAYENGQFDLLKDGRIKLVNDIFKSNITGSKKINQLYFYSSLVYIATDFGVLVYDLSKNQTKEVYMAFNSVDNFTKVNSTAILGDTLFVATSSGVYKASINTTINKLDFENWTLIPYRNEDEKPTFEHLASFNGKLYASKRYIYLQYKDGYFYTNSDNVLNSIIFKPEYGGLFNGFSYADNKLWILRENSFFSFDGTNGERKSLKGVENPSDLIVDTQGAIWAASTSLGLVSNKDQDTTFEKVSINGPGFLTAFTLSKVGNAIYAMRGGFNSYAQYGNDGEFSIFENGQWSVFKPRLKNIPNIRDLVNVTKNPFNGKIYFSSWGNGMMEWDGADKFKISNDSTPGVPLQNCNVGPFCQEPGAPYCRVAEIKTDSKGKMWILNPVADNSGNPMLFTLDLDGRWQAINWRGTDVWNSLDYSAESAIEKTPAYNIRRILIDRNDTKWMLGRTESDFSGGLLVYNENKYSLPRYLNYSKGFREEICGSKANCITMDNDGAIWIGTENGVCYFADPNEVFQRRTIKAAVPVFENKALLKGQNITAMEVDASNRKWIGTSNSGIWLFSSDGSKQVLHFDDLNSPLPSKYIVDIKVSAQTGEVFINTDKGMISYGGTSVDGTDKNTNVTIYPNPVKKEFDGFVAISGLVNNAQIKITDISGTLVFQTKAEGSLATWNVKDYNGRRPQPGIYLIFSATEDGGEALVNKIAIID